ncbi:hypothetical protein L7F22_045918 [Adiantum nelumboides]|nr:hypothetical protein [Adiantum nelumboides]
MQQRVLQYLKGTQEVGLKYVGNNIAIECFVDADWARDVATRKSTIGMVITMGGATVLWNSLRQSCVALSTAEAEYMALAHGVKESLWITSFMREAGLEMVTDKIPMWSDNQGAIAMAGQSGPSKQVKHVDIKFHFVKEQLEKGTIQLDYCPTTEMKADILTKPLLRERIVKLREALGIKRLKLAEGVIVHEREGKVSCNRSRGTLLDATNHTTCQLERDCQLDGHLDREDAQVAHVG